MFSTRLGDNDDDDAATKGAALDFPAAPDSASASLCFPLQLAAVIRQFTRHPMPSISHFPFPWTADSDLDGLPALFWGYTLFFRIFFVDGTDSGCAALAVKFAPPNFVVSVSSDSDSADLHPAHFSALLRSFSVSAEEVFLRRFLAKTINKLIKYIFTSKYQIHILEKQCLP